MDKEIIYVEMGEMKKAVSPDILWTDGLGPCIAIAVYDPVTKSGYMMHENHADLEAKIETIREDYGDLSRLRIFVTGSSLFSSDSAEQREFDLSERSYVEGIVKKYFHKRRAKIQWLPDNHCGELSLDISTGKFKAESEKLDDLLDGGLDD